MTCDICGGAGPHGIEECRANLLSRVRDVQRRAGLVARAPVEVKARTTRIKDQSGVALSEEYMRAHGLGRYGSRETANTLANRTTEPISLEHFLDVVVAGRCLACDAGIRHVRMRDGGRFWVCSADEVKGCGWSIGWNAEYGRGQQVRIVRVIRAA